jgi:putative transposase
MSYAFIRGHVDAFPVWAMCAALGVSRSGYYGWASRPESARAAADRALAAEIRAVREGSRGRYGSPVATSPPPPRRTGSGSPI